MLFSRLQSHTNCRLTGVIDGSSDNTSRRISLELFTDGEEGGMRATISNGDSKSLRVSDSDVEAQLTRRLQKGKSHQVSSTDGDGAGSLDGGYKIRRIYDATFQLDGRES